MLCEDVGLAVGEDLSGSWDGERRPDWDFKALNKTEDFMTQRTTHAHVSLPAACCMIADHSPMCFWI